MAAIVLPFVAYSSGTEVVIPAADWEGVYASLQTLKAHVQEYPGLPALRRLHPRRGQRRHARPLLHDVGHAPAARGVPERGYTLERLLADLGGFPPDWSLVMEKVF